MKSFSAIFLILAAFCFIGHSAIANIVTLKAGDAQGTSSFTGTTNWSNNAAPAATNDYVVNSFILRTPADGSPHTFGGGTLTVSNAPTSPPFSYSSAVLAYKGSGGAITVGTAATNGLFLDNAYLGSFQGSQAWTFNGFITLKSGGGLIEPQSGKLTLAAQISGVGSLNLLPTASASLSEGGTVLLTGSNSYSGGTIVNGTYILQIGNSNALGSANGSLVLTNGNSPTLDLNGNSIAVGNLAGVGGAKIFSSSVLPMSLTIGSGNSGGGNFAGAVQDGDATLALNKIGSGIITLSGTNTYSGGTTVSGGSLQMATASGQFFGGGTVVLMASQTNGAQFVSSVGNQFNGKWVVASGWLVGTPNGAFGTNDITVNPSYPLDASANGSTLAGAAMFEPRYDLNSAGKLTLTNGAKMLLHQNCAFSAGRIENNSLAAGTYSYATLAANFPNNFPPGGAGHITVQPFGSLPSYPPQLPQFEIPPQSQTNFPTGAAQFSAYAFGNPAPGYRWMAGVTGSGVYTNLTEGGQFSGTGSGTLSINNLSLANAADYVVVATNSSGSVTSAPARLTILQSAAIQTYPLPSIYSASSVYALTVNGTNVPVTSYTGDYDYAELSMSGGAATFQVTALTQASIVSSSVSPKKLGIATSASGNTLTFTISINQYLIVQINGLKRLVIGADAAEMDVPPSSGAGIFNVTNAPYNADNTGTTKTSAAIQSAINDASTYGNANGQGIVFVPTGVYLSGDLRLKSNVALYLQGGSVIRCTGNPADYTTNETFGPLASGMWFLSATNGFNMKIYGRGAVDADGGYMVSSQNFAVNTLMPINCTNFTADGVTFRDSGGWAIIPCIGGNMMFSHLKIFNQLSVGNDDGIDVNCAHDITVSNCIAIGLDDCYSTKTYTGIPWAGANMVNSNLVFDGCIAWTICYGFKVGQGVEQTQDGIIFRNGVVYDCAGALGIDHKNGTFPARNITFDTIDVERVSYVNAGHGAWGVFITENGLGDGGGPITNLIVRNITVRDAGTTGGFLQGISSFASVNNITFDHIYMPGSSQPASNLFQMVMTNVAFYSNVTILPTQTPEPLIITAQPTSLTQFVNQAATFSVGAWGNAPVNYQWQIQSNGAFVNLASNAKYSGAQTALLTVSNLALADSTNYLVIVSDFTGSVTSSVVMLTVSPGLGPPQNVTMSLVEPNQTPAVDWDTSNYWSNGQSTTTTATGYPGSTFEIFPGAAMRTPAATSTANFPGALLTVDGDGVFGSASLGSIILKGSNPSTINFPHLVMNGGSIGNGINGAGNAILGSVIEVVSNTIFSASNSGSGGSMEIAAQLIGTGSIEYHAYNSSTFQPTWVCDLNILGGNNFFSGTWNVVLGTLVASGNSALGTNTITVGTNGALQANYSINNPAGSLILNGRLNLTQTHRFNSVTVSGTPLAAGQYSFAQLNAAYPSNFPASWTAQPGASTTTASGSLIVGLPLTLSSSWNGSQLTLSWAGSGKLLQATNLAGPWLTNGTAQSPFPVTPSQPQMFYRIQY
jgi:autotransporter-associated beta strand protein